MSIQCIVCNSTAVIHKDAATTMAVLVNTISGAIQGASTPTIADHPTQASGPHGRILASCWR